MADGGRKALVAARPMASASEACSSANSVKQTRDIGD